MKTFTTQKGTILPLLNLKGKDYMQVAYRLQWFVEENPMYHIDEAYLVLNDEQTVCQVTINVANEKGQAVRKAVGVKRETKKDFSDHTEKAATGALGRALIQLGYGTQFAHADLDEGARLADSPLEAPTKKAGKKAAATPATDALDAGLAAGGTIAATAQAEETATPKSNVSSFRKVKKSEPEAKPTNGAGDDW